MDLRRNDIDRAADNTCAWLLKHQNYSSWLGQRYGLLWIKGKPGSGKSTLMDTVLRNVEQQAPVHGFKVASFFFHGRGSPMQKTPIGLFRSLLHQILGQIPPLLSELYLEFKLRREMRGEPGKAWNWDTKYLQEFLESEVLDMSKVYPIKIFIDALDECGEKAGRELVSYFQRLTSKSPATGFALSICFSCRHYPLMDPTGAGIEICVENENLADITKYVRDKLQPVFRDHVTQQSLERDILDKSSGVFLWVVLVVRIILDLNMNGENIKAIREQLELIPGELEHVYQDILKKIHTRDLPKSLQLMQWICLASRPLSLNELRFAMGFDTDTPYQSLKAWENSIHYVKDEGQMERKVKALSAGLVEVVRWNRWYLQVQFIHQSVKDYFMQGGLQNLEDEVYLVQEDLRSFDKTSSSSAIGRGHHRLSRSCIIYFTTEEILPKIIERHQISFNSYPFLDYAIAYWPSHAAEAERGNVSQQDLLDYFQWPSDSILNGWIFVRYGGSRWLTELGERSTIMHVASRYGLLSVLIAIFMRDNGTDPDPNDPEKRTPLWLAVNNRHEAVVKFLLGKRADPDLSSGHDRTPLSLAAEHGYLSIAKLLLEKGVDLHRQARGQAPLWWAARNGHEAVVKFLLLSGADQNSKSESGQTPLSWAAERGYENMVKLLLKAGASANTKSISDQTPLFFAVKNQHYAIAELLLENNANPDSYGQTPLSWAVENGCMPYVELLLEKGASPDFRSCFDRTTLLLAAKNGHDSAANLLLKKDVEPDSKDSQGRTPLSWAAEKGHETTVKLLLKKDVFLNSTDSEYGRTPLSWAAQRGRTAIVKLLLEGGADPDLESYSNRTPLFFAAENGCEDIVELLLEKGANPNAKDSNDRTPLLYAAMYGYVGVVNLLLNHPVDPNSKDSKCHGKTGWALRTGIMLARWLANPMHLCYANLGCALLYINTWQRTLLLSSFFSLFSLRFSSIQED
jgi:ankyrin repeat protein